MRLVIHGIPEPIHLPVKRDIQQYLLQLFKPVMGYIDFYLRRDFRVARYIKRIKRVIGGIRSKKVRDSVISKTALLMVIISKHYTSISEGNDIILSALLKIIS
jgi:hypothetical protein